MTYGCGKTAVLLALLTIASTLNPSVGETYECVVGNLEYEQGEYCIFRNVTYTKSTTNIAFKAPAGVQTRIAFENSEMDHLPKEFLNKFGKDLKVLNVVRCKLQSVVITNNMEELFATDNYIEKVIVHQQSGKSPIKSIHLQSNRLEDISNITKNCKNVTILDLSRNENLAKDSTIDFSLFSGLNQLEYLLLADVGALYINYDTLPSLPALTLLDLSMNNLIPADLQVDKLAIFESLRVLRFNDIGFAQLDYAFLTKLKSLEEVYLEGNSFDCKYLVTMINFLNEKKIKTPVARPAQSCSAGFKIEKEMCCKSDDLVMPIRPVEPVDFVDPIGPRSSFSSSMRPPVDLETHKTVTTMPPTKATTPTEIKTKNNSGNGSMILSVNLGCLLFGFVVAKMVHF